MKAFVLAGKLINSMKDDDDYNDRCAFLQNPLIPEMKSCNRDSII